MQNINSKESLANSPEVRAMIATRAYEIYESRSHAHGLDLQDWLQAEDEILSSIVEPRAFTVGTE